MEAVVRTQIELFRQNSNYLTIRTRARNRFFYLGAPQMTVRSVSSLPFKKNLSAASRGMNSAASR